jgi:hypothetical protein
MPRASTPKMSSVKQIFELESKYDGCPLAKSTVLDYIKRINSIAYHFNWTQKTCHPSPSVKVATKIFTQPDKVIQVLNDMFPINDNEDTKRRNVSNQKDHLTSIKTLVRSPLLTSITPQMKEQYNNRFETLMEMQKEIRAECKPTPNMEKNLGTTWQDIIAKRDAYLDKYGNNLDTMPDARKMVIIALLTYIEPRRLEYRHTRVFFNEPSQEAKNTIWIKQDGNVEMVLSEFKNAKVLPLHERILPEPLANIIKDSIATRQRIGQFKEGDHLLVRVGGKNRDKPFSSADPKEDKKLKASFSGLVNDASVEILGMGLGANDFRHYWMSHLNVAGMTMKQLEDNAIAMGDKNVTTNLSYIVPQANPTFIKQQAQSEVDINELDALETASSVPPNELEDILDMLYLSAKPYIVLLMEHMHK